MTERRVLDNWKEIAAYLGRTGKTCRNWEKEYGLPVHRLDGSPRAHVFAYADELERWKAEMLREEQKHKGTAHGLEWEKELLGQNKAGRLILRLLPRFFRKPIVAIPAVIILTGSIATAILVVSGLLPGPIRFVKRSPVPQTVKTIAVLPFADLSPGRDQEYLSDGISDTLINALNNIAGLRTSARTSVLRFKGSKDTPQEIGRKLNVEWILEGSVQVEKPRLRVLANLLRATDGTTVWTERYDRDAVDIFALEDEIALSVVKALQVKPPPKAGVQLIDRGTESPEAHELLLRAQHYTTKGFVFFERAIECLEQAIEKDPNFARAYSGLAACTYALGCNGLTEPEKAYPKAKTAALKALEIDPSDSNALIILASIKMVYEWDFSGAEQDIRKALRKDPAAPRLHLLYADLLSALGRHEEALEEAKQASDSALPHPSTVNGQAMFTLYRTRRYDLAVERLKKNLDLDPFYVATYVNLTTVYLAMGRYREARETWARLHEIRGVIEKQDKDDATSARIYAGTGKTAEARRILAHIKAKMKTSYVMPIEVAAVHAALGDRDEAFAWLEKAYRERCAYLYGIKCAAWFDSLRSDPRFTDLLRRIGLEK
jgi:TolB-like protein/Tfp pilus assembly protein PilF